MKAGLIAASVLAVVSPSGAAWAQATMAVPYGGTRPAPVPLDPANGPKDTPEEIAKDAARDLKDNRFYNKPGASRAQYDADWQSCRLIARGSRTPSGSVPYYYNPALVSPLAAGIGGGIGGAIAGAIAEGQQRRANRRACLLIRGWRLVELPSAAGARVAAMTDDQRTAYFNTIVGATQIDGNITQRTSFAQPSDAALRLDVPLTGPGTVFLGKKVDPKAPFAFGPDQAVVVIAYRRPDAETTGRSGLVRLARYDSAGRDLMYRPKDWKKTGDKTVYDVMAASADRNSRYEVQVLRVTPGDYVIASTAVVTKIATSSNCFGAPTFHVGPGEVAYVGDFLPYVGAKLSTGAEMTGLAYASHPEDARQALATAQPALAAKLRPATLLNRATYACSAVQMDRWDLPNVAALPELPAGG